MSFNLLPIIGKFKLKYLFNCMLLLIPLWSLVEEIDNNAYEVVKMLNFLFVNT